MTDIRARFIDALAQHLICDCGEWADNLDETAAHLADVLLALEGVAVVEIRALNRHIASGIQSYAGGESDGYSYHGDGSALEAMRHLSNQAAGLARYITTNLARAAEGGR